MELENCWPPCLKNPITELLFWPWTAPDINPPPPFCLYSFTNFLQNSFGFITSLLCAVPSGHCAWTGLPLERSLQLKASRGCCALAPGSLFLPRDHVLHGSNGPVVCFSFASKEGGHLFWVSQVSRRWGTASPVCWGVLVSMLYRGSEGSFHCGAKMTQIDCICPVLGEIEVLHNLRKSPPKFIFYCIREWNPVGSWPTLP